MPPILCFDHSSPNLNFVNPALKPASSLAVGRATSIDISIQNSGSDIGNANVHLFWVGPMQGPCTGPMMDLVNCNKLVSPFGASHPIMFSVPPTGGGKITVSWGPSAADFPKTLGHSVPGYLFAQIEVLPNPPTYPGDTSAITNWSPVYQLCAQYNVRIIT